MCPASPTGQNLNLYWPDGFCLLHPGEFLKHCPTELSNSKRHFLHQVTRPTTSTTRGSLISKQIALGCVSHCNLSQKALGVRVEEGSGWPQCALRLLQVAPSYVLTLNLNLHLPGEHRLSQSGDPWDLALPNSSLAEAILVAKFYKQWQVASGFLMP